MTVSPTANPTEEVHRRELSLDRGNDPARDGPHAAGRRCHGRRGEAEPGCEQNGEVVVVVVTLRIEEEYVAVRAEQRGGRSTCKPRRRRSEPRSRGEATCTSLHRQHACSVTRGGGSSAAVADPPAARNMTAKIASMTSSDGVGTGASWYLKLNWPLPYWRGSRGISS